MANYITTLKDDNGTDNLLPKTVLKAVADDNGNYLDSGLAASDINKLKGGEIVKLEENLARIETSPTTHAYSVGERLVYNGILYRVKAAISVGADLVVNTNIEKKSVDDALSDISAYIPVSITIKDNSFTISSNQSRYYPSLRIMVISFTLNSGNISSTRKTPVRIEKPSGVSSFTDQHLSCSASSSVDNYFNIPLGCWVASNGDVYVDKADAFSTYAQPAFWGVFSV